LKAISLKFNAYIPTKLTGIVALGFIIIPVGIGWMIASGFVLVKKAKR